MKVMTKILFILLIVFAIVFNNTYVNAGLFDDIIKSADDFEEIGEGIDIQRNQEFKNSINDLYVILLTIAVISAVIIGAVLGIQFLLASAEDKAKVKEALIPYIIGCIIAFGAFTIWKVVILVLS